MEDDVAEAEAGAQAEVGAQLAAAGAVGVHMRLSNDDAA